MTSRIRPSLVKTEILCMDNRETFLLFEDLIATIVHPLPLRVLMCIEKSMSFGQPPLLSPLPQESTFLLHVPLEPREEISALNALDGSIWQWQKPNQCPNNYTYMSMHRDAQSYTMPLKYVAVYMYSMSSMYSLRCCTLHVDL